MMAKLIDNSRRLTLSRLVLYWERLWPALWPVIGLLGLFVALALLDMPPHLPGWLHLALLLTFVVGVLGALWHGIVHFRPPSRESASRRLERVNALAHRPLEALEDELDAGAEHAAGRGLWALHQKRMAEAVARLRVGFPSPGLIRRDPIALRIALAVLLVIGGVSAGPDAGGRMLRAVSPDLDIFRPPRPAVVDAWITPPAYTGFPPMFLEREGEREAGERAAGEAATIVVPEHSVLAVRVAGGRGRPSLSRDGTPVEFTLVEDENYGLDLKLSTHDTIAVEQNGKRLAGWSIRVISDLAPTAAFLQPPGPTRRSALRIDFDARDDYGLVAVSAVIRRAGAAARMSSDDGEKIEIDLPLPRAGTKRAAARSFHDLTPHPWAGLPVMVQLSARDAAGQVGKSGAVRITMPERQFTHPVARDIVVERRKLTADPKANREDVSIDLRAIAWQRKRYDGDLVVFLSLTSAARRLAHDASATATAAVQKLLWDTALRVEDGKLSLAERALREAEQALRDALAKQDTGDPEIDRLLNDLQAALDSYFDELAEMMKKLDSEAQMLSPEDRRTMVLNRQDLQAIMNEIRNLARSGAREAARRLLAQLQSILENMRTGRMARVDEQSRQAMQALNELQEIIKGQQELLDKTFREAQRRRGAQRSGPMRRGPQGPGRQGRGQLRQDLDEMLPGGSPSPRGGQPGRYAGDVSRQETLRRQLGDLMRRLGEMTGAIPRPMGRAEQSMRDSTKALRFGEPGNAVGPQTRAVDQLQQAAKMATQQLMRRLGQGPGGRQSRGRLSRPQDPFGRNLNEGRGGFNTSDVDIPGEDTLQRARRIRDELRRRAGQRSRPRLEHEYIERLLKQF